MARLMSVAFTEDAVRDRTKTVTRRKGWTFAKPGDRVTLCRKVMGRKKDEPLERIVDVELVAVTREPLRQLTDDQDYGYGEVIKEGGLSLNVFTPEEFVQRFFVNAQGMSPADMVTRLEWRYLDDEAGA